MTSRNALTESHGVLVEPGRVRVSAFLHEAATKNGDNSRFDGTMEDLERLATEHLENFEPGVGSVENDVRLIRVPAMGFYTNIVAITDDNASQLKVRYSSRVKGEAPVTKTVLETMDKVPATAVKLVAYRADVLARDDDRSSMAEWELVAILAQPQETVPMHPMAMARNALNHAGGTYREYTSREWAEAVDFWQSHAYAERPACDEPVT